MAKLIIFKGLPASGKSTRAEELLKDPAYRRVNKDSFREMLNNYDYENSDEKLVHDLYIKSIHYCLERGYNTIADATNLSASNEKELRIIARGYGADVEVEFFDTPVDECIRRDALRTGRHKVGEDVIRKFHDRFLANRKFFKVENPLVEEDVPEVQEYSHTPGLPWAIMCDLDGTLANMNGRSPFNWKACINDLPHDHIAEILSRYEPEHCLDLEPAQIIFMSGRDEVCREETTQWLKNQGFYPDYLYMRPEGDQRKDNIIKRELFDAHVRGKFNIMFILDDRDQVVEMWRAMGLVCLQVAEGNF